MIEVKEVVGTLAAEVPPLAPGWVASELAGVVHDRESARRLLRIALACARPWLAGATAVEADFEAVAAALDKWGDPSAMKAAIAGLGKIRDRVLAFKTSGGFRQGGGIGGKLDVLVAVHLVVFTTAALQRAALRELGASKARSEPEPAA